MPSATSSMLSAVFTKTPDEARFLAEQICRERYSGASRLEALANQSKCDTFVLATLALSSQAATHAFGVSLGKLLVTRDFILLSGDLGMGKTALTQGIAQGIGATDEPVISPTFTIVNEYHSGRLPLYHLDLYRIHGEDAEANKRAVTDIDLAYIFESDGAVVVEWGDLFDQEFPDSTLEIHIEAPLRSTAETPEEAHLREVTLIVRNADALAYWQKLGALWSRFECENAGKTCASLAGGARGEITPNRGEVDRYHAAHTSHQDSALNPAADALTFLGKPVSFDAATTQLASGVYLLIDSASDAMLCGVAEVSAKSGTVTLLAAGDMIARRIANERLTLTIKSCLDQAKKMFADVRGIVVGRGPGSFTGVRIAIATAKGIAAASHVPVYGVSALDASAHSAWAAGARGHLTVVLDAMRQEVYPGAYQLTDERVERLFEAETVIKAQSFAETQDLTHTTVLGDGLFKHEGLFEDAVLAPQTQWRPTSYGLMLAWLEGLRSQRITAQDCAQLLPIYTRLSDAEETERIRLGRGQKTKAVEALSTTGVSNELVEMHRQLKPMSLNDCVQAARLEQEAYDEHHICWSEQQFIDEIQGEHRIWWAAHDQGALIGFAGAHLIAGDAEILNVAVHPDYRGQQKARQLIKRVLYDAVQMGALSASLEVSEVNERAIHLYESLGFEVVGRRPRYYQSAQKDGTAFDALLMRADLPLHDVEGFESCVQDVSQSAKPEVGEPCDTIAPQLAPEIAQTAQAALAELKDRGPIILAIETSCDETAMAIIDGSGELLANVISTQIDFHARFGGVVPEIASRKHTEVIVDVYRQALHEAATATKLMPQHIVQALDAIAVTQGPGLVGALVVGVAFAKGLAVATSKKLIGINHMEGHLYANLYENPKLKPPFVTSLISGGHTMLVHVKDWGDYEVLGQTIDDAVGEAFDKVSRALGFGYPGGPIISALAKDGDASAIDFPRALLHSGDYRFSLSGLKTAVMTYIEQQNKQGKPVPVHDLCASFEAAVFDVQVAKALVACEKTGVKDYCLGGGVAANPSLRQRLVDELGKRGVRVTLPPIHACTDNAAMIARVALEKYAAQDFDALDMDARANLSLSRV